MTEPTQSRAETKAHGFVLFLQCAAMGSLKVEMLVAELKKKIVENIGRHKTRN